MKLVPKLTAALVAGTFAVLVANGYFRVQREVAVLQADRVRDHALLGRALGAAVSSVWRAEGRADALRVVEGAADHGGRIHVRFVEQVTNGKDVRVEASLVAALGAGESVTRIATTPAGEQRFTYAPVSVSGTRMGLLELSEPLEVEERAVHGIVVDTIVTTLTLALVSGALSIVLGFWFVGRPVRALSEKARRIGEGNFTSPLALPQNDELGSLAREINSMCERLLAANERIASETAARLATLEQLRHADRLMTVGKLASGIAHELGTPLNVISARASMIAAGDTSATETLDYARIIGEAARRMAKIIRHLLAFARRKAAEKAPHDLRKLAVDTLELLRPLADKRSIHFEVRSPEPELMFNVDAGEIQQALTNLVVNALQAMDQGGTIEVAIERESRAHDTEHPGDYVCVRVHDEGTGITAGNLPHIFEPFFTTKDVGEGTGLGLSVTHGIVESHGGWLRVESEAKKGAVFSIYLPVQAAT